MQNKRKKSEIWMFKTQGGGIIEQIFKYLANKLKMARSKSVGRKFEFIAVQNFKKFKTFALV